MTIQALLAASIAPFAVCAVLYSCHVASAQETQGSIPAGDGNVLQRLNQLEHQNQRLTTEYETLKQRLVGFESDSATVPCGKGSTSSCCRCGHCGLYSCQCPQEPAPCVECPHVSTLQPYWNLSIFGSLVTDAIFCTSRPVAPGTPFFLAPDSPLGFDTDTFDMHARQTLFGVALSGPEVCGLQCGGLAMATLYNDAVIVDRYGFLPLQAYGELKNERMRISAGLQFDVFSPNTPNVLPFSILSGSGNSGNNFRGQVRLERYVRLSQRAQWTLQLAVSEPIATGITPDLTITEDNGWPNVEGRILFGAGEAEQVGLEARRPFELGVAGVVGQVRRTQLANRVVSDVWGAGVDARWKISQRFGMQGELFHGQGLGTYNAGILQTINVESFDAVRASGGWFEFWYYWTPCLHSHFGYGIDDPLDRDLRTTAPLSFARVRNETWFANWLWDVTPNFRIGFELTWRETAYDKALDAEAAGFHTQLRWNF